MLQGFTSGFSDAYPTQRQHASTNLHHIVRNT